MKNRFLAKIHHPGKFRQHCKTIEATVLWQQGGQIYFEDNETRRRYKMSRMPPTLCVFVKSYGDVRFHTGRCRECWDKSEISEGSQVRILVSTRKNRDHTWRAMAWTSLEQWNKHYPQTTTRLELQALG